MSKPPVREPAQNRRASREAVEKRRAARAFNEVVAGQVPRPHDGRTERRRRRLLKELAQGARNGQELKPIEVLLRAQALLDLGEPLASIEQARPAPAPVPISDALVAGLRNLHAAYAFAPTLYRLVGIDDAALVRAGILRAKRGPVKTGLRAPPGATRRGAA